MKQNGKPSECPYQSLQQLLHHIYFKTFHLSIIFKEMLSGNAKSYDTVSEISLWFYIAYIYFLSLKGQSLQHFKGIQEVQCIQANPSPTKMKPPPIKYIPAVPNTHFPELTSTKALENRSALKCGLIINKYRELLQVEHFRVKSSTRKMKTLAPESNCFLAHLVIDFQLPLLPEVWILHIPASSLPHSSSIIPLIIDKGMGESIKKGKAGVKF